VVDGVTPGGVEEVIEELNKKYLNNDLSFRIRKIAGGYQCYIIEDYVGYVEELLTRRRNVRLTKAALETLAIVSYRQPVTKIDVEMIRGVASDSVLHTLLERKLVTIAGRAETVGKPLLYKTTDDFLKYFNLNSLDDLPRMEEIEELLATGDSESQQSLPLGSQLSNRSSITLKTLGESTEDKTEQLEETVAVSDDTGEREEKDELIEE
jgi:segregation and condensation protein B